MKRMNKIAKNNYIIDEKNAIGIISIILNFLAIFMPMTLAKRVVGIILIAVGLQVSQIAKMTGITERSIRSYGKVIREGKTDSLLKLKEGRGRKGKAADVETEIIEEVEKGNYHTRQQIADMIKEKFQISISVYSIGRLLKKRRSQIEERFFAR